MIAAKLAESIGNQPRIGRSGIAKRSVCLLIWHCLTSEDAGHCNASLLPREILKHFTGASQGLLEGTREWRETRASGPYAAIDFLGGHATLCIPLSPWPFDLTRAAFLLGCWRNACVEALGLPAETRAGMRCPEIAEMGLRRRWIHCSSRSLKSWAGRQKPVATTTNTTCRPRGCVRKHAARRCAISGRNGTR